MLGRKIKIFLSSNLPSCSLKSQKSTKAAALVALVVMTPLSEQLKIWWISKWIALFVLEHGLWEHLPTTSAKQLRSDSCLTLKMLTPDNASYLTLHEFSVWSSAFEISCEIHFQFCFLYFKWVRIQLPKEACRKAAMTDSYFFFTVT